MAKRSKPDIADRIADYAWDSGESDNRPLARKIRRAIQSAATYAMMQERGRIRWAIINRSGITKDKESRITCGDIMNDLEGPMSGAPTKGRVKK